MRFRNTKTIGLLMFATFSWGCATYRLNEPVSEDGIEFDYSFSEEISEDEINTNEVFICLAFSGGGTRAAALSYGVLEKLRETTFERNEERVSLLEEVDLISSVSGGSFTAAYYGLFGDRIFLDYRENFLYRNVHRGLILRMVRPDNLWRLASPWYSRIDLAADYYDRILFENSTFGDLGSVSPRPFIMINATDMATGGQFTFVQEDFRVLGSDLSSYPVARAVAASSAFPFLLRPISMKNYDAPRNEKLTNEMKMALQDHEYNRDRFRWADNRAFYLDARIRPYMHLIDGGLSDNVGTRRIQTKYRRGALANLIEENEVNKLVVIIVNAKTEDDDRISRRSISPGIYTVGKKTATTAMENYSEKTIEALRMEFVRREQEQRDHERIGELKEKLGMEFPELGGVIDTYFIEISFDQIADEEVRNRFLSMPTNFNLPKQDVDALIRTGGKLLESNSNFKELLENLD